MRVRTWRLVRALALGLLAGVGAAPRALAQGDTGTARIALARFTSGDSLADVHLHYRTLGRLRRDAGGTTINAVLLLHGTGASGDEFLVPVFANGMFGAGQPLDTSVFFVILPDDIGHGRSSKPSDGLRARFPRYTDEDMVDLQRRLLTETLGVNHLLLVLGTSMGCRHAWIWGTRYPDFADGLLPMACVPAAVAGRNRMMRRAMMDDIRLDPAWQGGDYREEPPGLRAALQVLILFGGSPLIEQRLAPTREAADQMLERRLRDLAAVNDANDLLYALDASRDYDPAPLLSRVRARVLAVNSADDQINPPELGIAERLVATIPGARFVLLPIGPLTIGHVTFVVPAAWKADVGPFIAGLARARGLLP